MVGSPVKKEEIARIEEKGGEEIVFGYLADGLTLSKIAQILDVNRGILSQFCNRKERKERYQAARKAGAEAYAEQGLDLVDSANPENVQVKKLQSDYRKYLAGKLDHEAWGDKGSTGTVNINLNNLHLDAVRELSKPKPKDDWLDAVEGEVVDDGWLE